MAEPVEIRAGIGHAARFKQLQEEIAEIADLARNSIRIKMTGLASECDAALAYPLGVGEKEEYRKLADALRSASDRLDAIRARK